MAHSKLKVAGIDHVGLNVRDLARSKEFYIEFLGMEPIQDMGRMSFLRCGNQMLTLMEVAKKKSAADNTASAHPPKHSMNHIALRLSSGSFEQVKSLLEAAGHPAKVFRGDIYFSDPDGYEVQLLVNGT